MTYYSVVDRAANVHLLAVAEARDRPHPPAPRPHRPHRPSDHRRPEISAKEIESFPDGLPKKLHLHARRITLPHPRGGTLDVTAPLPPHMRQSFDMLGFDASAYDPIVDAPEE